MENGNEEKFVGRHEEFCLVRKLLGEEVPDLEIQIAKNKDISERTDILNRLEDIEGYVSSEYFTHDLAVSEARDEIMKLISDAGRFCISENDPELGKRLYKILDNIMDYVKAKYRRNEELTEELAEEIDDISKTSRLADFLTFLQLHDLLNTSDHQMGFYIWNSLVRKNGFIVTLLQFNKGMNREGSTDESLEFVENYPKRLTEFSEGLLRAGRISDEEMERIREEISYAQ